MQMFWLSLEVSNRLIEAFTSINLFDRFKSVFRDSIIGNLMIQRADSNLWIKAILCFKIFFFHPFFAYIILYFFNKLENRQKKESKVWVGVCDHLFFSSMPPILSPFLIFLPSDPASPHPISLIFLSSIKSLRRFSSSLKMRHNLTPFRFIAHERREPSDHKKNFFENIRVKNGNSCQPFLRNHKWESAWNSGYH